MKDDYNEELELRKKITEELCRILKNNDLKLYNKYMNSTDSFKWEMMTYLMFHIGQFKTLEEAVKSYIEQYNKYGAKIVNDEIELCCALRDFDTKGENYE